MRALLEELKRLHAEREHCAIYSNPWWDLTDQIKDTMGKEYYAIIAALEAGERDALRLDAQRRTSNICVRPIR